VFTVAVLGEVEAYRDGVRVDLPTGKTTELLSRLAVDAGVSVRTDVLLEDLWGGPTSRNTLQSKVSQLRRALGKKDVLQATANGYVLAVAPEATDVTSAVRLAAASSAARLRGDPGTALDRAREGLALFRGEVLLEAGDWAETHRFRLGEVRLGLVEDAMAARVDLGSGADVVVELEELVRAHPLREGLWAALITALYRAGRQADALATYTRLRRLLADQLGIDPGPALQTLEHQVLTHSAELGATGAPPVRRPGNLATSTVPIVGRAPDISDLIAALESHRLVTVLGPAGVGKTRVAVEVVQRLSPPGGVWLVRLDAVEPDAVLIQPDAVLVQLVAETLHVPDGEQALADRLSASETVLLLDNCEHLAESVARLVSRLMAAAPQLRVLVTSQVPLGLEDEHRHPLEPLTHQESVTLFTRRAQELRRHFILDPSTTAVVGEICRSLDGLPLAIELAACRVRSLSVKDIARHLDDRFMLLRDPTSHRPPRQRALQAAIEWSYGLLFPDDQRGLWALSCFAGSASLSAAEAVLTDLGVPAGAVLDTIGRLVDRSLVNVDIAEGGEVRYRLLDSIRAYARDRLRESGLADRAAAAHAQWYGATAGWCDAHIRTDQQPGCLAIARVERANIDLALSWCSRHDPVLGIQIANGFGWTWVVLGDGTAGAARVRNAVAAGAPTSDRATALLLAAWLEASAGDVDLAQHDLEQAQALAEEVADTVLLADVQRHQAFVAIQQGRADLVLRSAEDSLATYRPRGLAWRTAASLLLAAFGSLMLGDTISATRNATESVPALSAIGDSWAVVHGQALLAGIAQAEGRLDDAATALERAADESAVLGFSGQAALHRSSLGHAQQRAGDPRAATTYGRAIAEAVAGGDGRLAATARLRLAQLQRTAGSADHALALLEENQRWYAAAGGGDFALLNDGLLASVRNDAARVAVVLEAARSDTNLEIQVYMLDALARLAAAGNDGSTARLLLAEANQLATQVGHLLDQKDRYDSAEALKQLE
jgi:predicted ATPase/DNA-binding SARP family transcriptional activator